MGLKRAPGPVAALLVAALAPPPLVALPPLAMNDQLVVQLTAKAEAHPMSVLGSLEGSAVASRGHHLAGDRWAFEVPADVAERLSAKLATQPGVAYSALSSGVVAAGYVPASAPAVVPDNPCYDSSCGPSTPVVVEEPALGAGVTVVHPNGQSDLWAVNAAQAWAITKGSPHVLVAVLDTGVNASLAQLAGKVEVGPNVCEWDLSGCSSDADQNGHGTWVSGLIAATPDDGIGIAGLGWETRILDIKVLNASGQGYTTDEATGIYDAVSMGAKVINLSEVNECGTASSKCGPHVPQMDQQVAIEYALAHGVAVVAAAGNLASSKAVYPADYPGVLSVAASTDQGVVNPDNGGVYLDYSDFGNDANIAAPGDNVLSTWYDGNYAVETGTSFAAPHVSAVIALMLAANPRLSGPEAASLLMQSAAPLTPGGTSINGGFLNAETAVQAAQSAPAGNFLDGYQMVSADGSAYGVGFVGDEPRPATRLKGHVVAVAETPQGLGYWEVTTAGQVLATGDARLYGPARRAPFAHRTVAIAPTPDGHGYWLLDERGDVYAYGNARNYGSAAPGPEGQAFVGIASAPKGKGYWLVTSKGEVLAFGDAHYYGSTVKLHLARPVVAIAATPDGHGYWLVGADGGVFNYGDAQYFGSQTGNHPGQAIVGIVPSPGGDGYWLVSSSGRAWDLGEAPFEPSAPLSHIAKPIVAVSG